MDEQDDSHSADIEIVREVYAALNRGDAAGFVKDFHTDVERVEFEDSPNGGAFSGIDAVKEHVEAGRSTWAEGSCEPQAFTLIGDCILVAAHVRVRLKDQSDWLEGDVADVFKFRDGKVVSFQSYSENDKAVAWCESQVE